MSATASAVRAQSKKPVHRYARWMCVDPAQQWADGCSCCLQVEVGNEVDVYEVTPTIQGGFILSWKLSKCDPAGEVHEYTLPGNLSRCDCPHSQYRPNGAICRHRASLKAALAKIGFAV